MLRIALQAGHKKMTKTSKTIKKQFTGIVVSDKMDKTIVARVDRVKAHPKYGKRYKVSKKFKVHDEKNEHKVGDEVIFVECRPLSKDKRWRVSKTLNSELPARNAVQAGGRTKNNDVDLKAKKLQATS